jgi:flagellar biogenesis protein FliO
MKLFLPAATALSSLPVAAAARAQQLGGAASPDVSVVRVFLALLVCLVIAVLAALLLRHRVRGRPGGSLLPRLASANSRIRLIESRRISPQSELVLFESDGTEYLLALGAGGILLLHEHPAASGATPG